MDERMGIGMNCRENDLFLMVVTESGRRVIGERTEPIPFVLSLASIEYSNVTLTENGS